MSQEKQKPFVTCRVVGQIVGDRPTDKGQRVLDVLVSGDFRPALIAIYVPKDAPGKIGAQFAGEVKAGFDTAFVQPAKRA